MRAAEEGLIITGLVIPATAFPVDQPGKPLVPDAGGGRLVQAEGLGTMQMRVEGLAQTQIHAAAHALIQARIAMFFKKTPPPDEMPTLASGKRSHHAAHGSSIRKRRLSGPGHAARRGVFLDLPGRRVYRLPHVKSWRRSMFGIGIPELLIILVIILVIFGANKLPEIGAGMGKAIKNFKKATSEPEEIDVTPKKDDEPVEKK
jgi:sec-independent protein translocase protein TatA